MQRFISVTPVQGVIQVSSCTTSRHLAPPRVPKTVGPKSRRSIASKKTCAARRAGHRHETRQERSKPNIDTLALWLTQSRAPVQAVPVPKPCPCPSRAPVQAGPVPKPGLCPSRARVSAKSPTGEAPKYSATYRDGLILVLSDGRIDRDNTPAKRTIRPIALNRKTALFAGHDAGAQTWAILASLIETCKLNGIEPHGDLSAALTAIAHGHKQTDTNKPPPGNFAGTA